MTVQHFVNLWLAHWTDDWSKVRSPMFHLLLTTCFAGGLCFSTQPAISYISAERCLEQGAILSGLARAHLHLERAEQSSRIVCSGADGAKATVYIGRADTPPPQFPEDAMTLPLFD